MNNNQSFNNINISTKTILKVIGIILVLIFLYIIKEVLAIVFVAWVLASAINPLIDKLQKHKIPRSVSLLSIYLVFICIIILVFVLLIPPLVNELTNLTKDLPNYYNALLGILDSFKKTGTEYGVAADMEKIFTAASDAITNLSKSLYNFATSFIGGVATFIAILVIVFYMTMQEEGIKKFIQSITPANYQPYIIQKINRIQSKLGSWLWGEIILMFFIGAMTAIALQIIGVKYVLVLAIIAGLCEFIPIVGPIVSAIPAVLFTLVDFADSPVKPLLVIIVYIVIQQIENQFLVPRIMHRSVGLNPIVIMITLLIGAQIGGIVGIMLAVPAATIISIFLEDFFNSKKEEANKLEGEEYIKNIKRQ